MLGIVSIMSGIMVNINVQRSTCLLQMRNLLYPKKDSWSSLHCPTPTLNLNLKCSSAYLWQLHPSSHLIQTLKSSLIPSYIPHSISNALANPFTLCWKYFQYMITSHSLHCYHVGTSYHHVSSGLFQWSPNWFPASNVAVFLPSLSFVFLTNTGYKHPFNYNSDHVPSVWKASSGHPLTWNKT